MLSAPEMVGASLSGNPSLLGWYAGFMLYVCPTPIGNLEDVTLRVLRVLKAADLVVCEDTRRTGLLFRRHGIKADLVSFHEHNERARLELLLAGLREGKTMVLVCDAGMPGLSDPGFILIRACAEEGLPLSVLPGPSAVSTALVASALPIDRFTFVGFLPRSRRKLAAVLEEEGRAGGSVVAFESPRRLRGTLETVAALWPTRPLAVCRELTKLHEEVLRGTAGEVLTRLGERIRGEIVLVLGPAEPAGLAPASRDERRAVDALAVLLRHGFRTKEAATLVAKLTGIPGRRAYDLATEVGKRPAGGIAG